MADKDKVIHLLRRTEYVVKPKRLKALTKRGVTLAEAVDDILDFSKNPSDVTTFDPDSWESRDAYIQWWIKRMATVPRPMQEKLTFFWHGHFVSSLDKVDYSQMVEQMRLFRRYCIGDLRVFAQKMAVQPAMLFYLDNLENYKDSPNQNFARELMELFTLGITNPDTGTPNYSEGDVEAAAAAWTGHHYDWETGKYRFYPDYHDGGNKKFFGKTKRWDGPDIIDEILRDNPKKRKIAARFIARKLWDNFAYPIPPGPHPEFIHELADVFIAANMSIRALVKAMLLRDEFYSKTARQGLVRAPTEYMVALHHHTKIPLDEYVWSWDMDGTGQVPLYPPNVSGWRPNGYWINTTAVAARANTASRIADMLVGWDNEADNGEGARRPLGDWITEATPAQVYDRLSKMFYRDPDTEISLATKTAIMDYLRGESFDDWWFPYYVVGMFLMAPEFHLA